MILELLIALLCGVTAGTITRKTRDEAYHYASAAKEKRMHKAIGEIQKNFNSNEKDKQKKLF